MQPLQINKRFKIYKLDNDENWQFIRNKKSAKRRRIVYDDKE